MDMQKLAGSLTPEQLSCLVSAMESKALLLSRTGELYAARRYGEEGWWVWKLEHSSEEHFVSSDFERCTCKAEPKPCKHILMLKHGSDVEKAWPKRKLQTKRRPMQRGER